jgi:hypothetical protein
MADSFDIMKKKQQSAYTGMIFISAAYLIIKDILHLTQLFP